MIVLPFLSLLLWCVLFRARARSLGDAVLQGAILWGSLLVVSTELLSVLQLLRREWVAGTWLLLVVVAGGLLWRRRESAPEMVPESARSALSTEPWLFLAVVLSAMTTAVVALAASPNTWDGMTYHLPRVMHWIQNETLENYPTAIERQLHFAPFAEMVVLHFQLLAGGDRFANLVQWLAMVGSLVGVWRIAEQLGAERRVRLLAVVVCATLPMGVLQATSTSADHVVSFWLVGLVYLVVRWVRAQGSPATKCEVFLVGACLGLALLSKPTAYLFAAPFGVWLAWSRLRVAGVRGVSALLGVAVVAMALNAGYFWRNLTLYGWPLGDRAFGDKHVNQTFTPGALVSNLIRNGALHFTLPGVDARVERGVERVHRLLGISAVDPRTSWPQESFELGPALHEDHAGNPLHLALVLVCLGVVAVAPRSRSEGVGVYAVLLVAGYLLFCFFLKWQPYGSRHQLPLFVLASPLVAVGVSRWLGVGVVRFLGALLLATSIPYLIANAGRPLVGPSSVLTTPRMDQYFTLRPHLREPYVKAAAILGSTDCRDIALWLGADGWEYPLWVLLARAAPGPSPSVTVQHFVFAETLASLSERGAADEACAILRVEPTDIPSNLPPLGGLAWSEGPVSVLVLESGP